MARAWVELPEGWGPQRVITVAWQRGGYSVERHVSMATGEARLMVFGNAKGPHGGGPR